MNHGFPKSLARRRADYFAIGEISPASTLRWNAKVLRTGVDASITEPPSAATTLVSVLYVAFMPIFAGHRPRDSVSIAASGRSLSSSPPPPIGGHNLLPARMRLRWPGQRDYGCERN
jgi:hypothetical protein